MDSTYLLFKFLHVAAASVWIGGLVAVAVLNARLSAESDIRMIGAIARNSRQIGRFVLGPSAVLTLIAGGVTMGVADIGFAGWIVWGLVAIGLSVALGATVVRRLVERIAAAERMDASIAALQRRLAITDAVLVLLLLSAIWAMVYKPTF